MSAKPIDTSGVQNELEETFRAFNQLSVQLASSYNTLEDRIARLNNELVVANQERLEQLAEKERLAARLSNLLTALPAGVLVINAEGIVQQANPTAVTIVGEPLVGQIWREIIARAFSPANDAGTDAVLLDGRRITISTCPLGTEPGQIILMIDVTETRALQEALTRHKRLTAMGEMAARLAHQIRTPVASCLLYASHLVRPKLADTERRRYADKVLSQLRHLEHIVNDTLSFTRGAKAGTEIVGLSELVSTLAQNVEAQLIENECQLDVQDNAPGARVQGDHEALLSALQNLVANAIQACGSGGRFNLSVHVAKAIQGISAVDIVFSDNGPGIAENLKDRIFEPFFTTRQNGTGLGLAVVQAVIQAHGGAIWLEATPRSGATFIMRLPMQNTTPDIANTLRKDRKALNKRNIA
ncbi:MAG: ATP-binding protein [Gammaproteobacteria bacterium]|nr:ATP-binding protein [Gammaproteobacteria bacterium]